MPLDGALDFAAITILPRQPGDVGGQVGGDLRMQRKIDVQAHEQCESVRLGQRFEAPKPRLVLRAKVGRALAFDRRRRLMSARFPFSRTFETALDQVQEIGIVGAVNGVHYVEVKAEMAYSRIGQIRRPLLPQGPMQQNVEPADRLLDGPAAGERVDLLEHRNLAGLPRVPDEERKIVLLARPQRAPQPAERETLAYHRAVEQLDTPSLPEQRQ